MSESQSSSADPSSLDCRAVTFRRAAFVLLAVAVVVAGLLFPFPVHTRRWARIFDLAHAPAFGLLLLLIVGLPDPPAIGLSRRFTTIVPMTLRRVLPVIGALLGLGLIGEFLQRFTAGRSPSWHDVFANSAGLLAAACWIAGRANGGLRRATLTIAAPAVLAAVSVQPVLEIYETLLQGRQMPRLASFERPRELHGWSAKDADMQRSTDWATDGNHSLQVTLRSALYPGVAWTSPESDWRTYDTLLIDFRNPNHDPLPLVIKVHDRDHAESDFDHRDRFHRNMVLPPGETYTLRIDLKDIRFAPASRPMNMADISFIEIFAVDLRNEQTFLMDNLRLE